MLQDDYRVTLDSFHGPLDLLLFLIRRAEVDIHHIPVAAITDQYLGVLRHVDDVDVDLAGEFLVMAATLIELKSRTLVPPEERDDDEQAGTGGAAAALDPRDELVRQLLAYQRYRIAAEELDARRESFTQRFRVRPSKRTANDAEPLEEDVVEIELEDVHIMDLAEAYERIMASIDFTRLGDHVVEIDDTPIALHQADLMDRLSNTAAGRLTLQSAFDGQPSGQRIGLFLATLELVRQRLVTVLQDDIESEIEVILLDGAETIEGIRRESDEGASEAMESIAGTPAGS